MRYNKGCVELSVVLFIGVGVRSIVSLSSYSGAAAPPLFGDYEAQRHWQEITFNLPAEQWYTNSSDNDLLYWGLDYPPLTAYHSLIIGIIANRVNSSYVNLHKSRGYESSDHKSFMRLTVLLVDILIYIPASLLTILSMRQMISSKYTLSTLSLLLLYPGQILVDNGHFQYNNMSLGLFLFAVNCILKNRYNWASFFFSLALNYKQMELYHALPLFIYLLKISFSGKLFSGNIVKLLQIGLITCLTFALLWLPWVTSLDTLGTLLHRLFPIDRGLFEDKVANIWCSLSVIYKFKEKLHNKQMALICLVTTLIAVLPSNIKLFTNCEKKSLLHALMNTSLSFFLFSFQVHEKSILLAAIPLSCLFGIMPFNVHCFMKVSVLSLFPLFLKDSLHVSYFTMIIFYWIIFKYLIKIIYTEEKITGNILSSLMDILDTTVFIMPMATIFLQPPGHYPHLWSLLISVYCCMIFILCLIFSTFLQFSFLVN